MHASLPDELTLHIFGFCSAKCLLTVEAASRALRDLRRHKTDDALWCGLLRARWPREGPVLCSLRPRATARQLFRAFATKRDARTEIMRRPERVVEDVRDYMRLDEEDEANDVDRLAFILCVGPYAGLARWMQVPDGLPHSSAMKTGLRWQPQADETCFDIEIPEDIHTWDEVDIEHNYGDVLGQSLHVLDLRTLKCVTAFSNVVPHSINIQLGGPHPAFPLSLRGDVTTYTSREPSFRHNHMIDMDGLDLQQLYEEDRLGPIGYSGIESCILDPFLRLRVASGKLRLYEGDLSSDHGQYMTVTTPHRVREYLTDTIEQTHEEGWQRREDAEAPSDGSRGWYTDALGPGAHADNRRRDASGQLVV